jgi:hypothetical protein
VLDVAAELGPEGRHARLLDAAGSLVAYLASLSLAIARRVGGPDDNPVESTTSPLSNPPSDRAKPMFGHYRDILEMSASKADVAHPIRSNQGAIAGAAELDAAVRRLEAVAPDERERLVSIRPLVEGATADRLLSDADTLALLNNYRNHIAHAAERHWPRSADYEEAMTPRLDAALASFASQGWTGALVARFAVGRLMAIRSDGRRLLASLSEVDTDQPIADVPTTSSEISPHPSWTADVGDLVVVRVSADRRPVEVVGPFVELRKGLPQALDPGDVRRSVLAFPLVNVIPTGRSVRLRLALSPAFRVCSRLDTCRHRGRRRGYWRCTYAPASAQMGSMSMGRKKTPPSMATAAR